jgi:hypothetical protein
MSFFSMIVRTKYLCFTVAGPTRLFTGLSAVSSNAHVSLRRAQNRRRASFARATEGATQPRARIIYPCVA